MAAGGKTGLMSVVYSVLAVAIAFVFVLGFRPGATKEKGSLTVQCAVSLGNRCVSPKEFMAALGIAIPRGADDNRVRAMGARRQVAEGIIERLLLVEDAKRLGITISDDEVNADLVNGRFRISLPAAHPQLGFYLGLSEDGVRLVDVKSTETKKFDYKTYTRVVRNVTGRSPSEFKEMQREEAIADRMRKLIASRASVSDAEAFDIYQREKGTAKLHYVRLQKDYFANRYLDTSPAAVQAWKKNHEKEVEASWNSRKASFPAGCVQARHIVFQVAQPPQPNAQPDDQPRGHAREEAQGLIEKARKRLTSGEPFAVVARDMSEDTNSASKGGDLGCFKPGKFPKEFEDVVFKQTKTGLVDAVLESPVGMHLVFIELIVSNDEKAAEQQGQMQVAKELMTALETEAIVANAAKQVQNVAQKGTALGDAMDQVLAKLDEDAGIKPAKKAEAQEQNATQGAEDAVEDHEPGRPYVQTTASFSRVDGNPIEDVAPGEHVVSMAFALAKTNDVGQEPVRLTNGYAVIQLAEKTEMSRDEFDKERDEFIYHITRVKQLDLVSAYVANLRELAFKDIKYDEKWVNEPERRKGQSDDDSDE